MKAGSNTNLDKQTLAPLNLLTLNY